MPGTLVPPCSALSFPPPPPLLCLRLGLCRAAAGAAWMARLLWAQAIGLFQLDGMFRLRPVQYSRCAPGWEGLGSCPPGQWKVSHSGLSSSSSPKQKHNSPIAMESSILLSWDWHRLEFQRLWLTYLLRGLNTARSILT